ncbi:MAG: hypothetical protein KAH84_02120 [Thiomargarita sp.]|nr:hypothetical protein [Thiomargarita sp.]
MKPNSEITDEIFVQAEPMTKVDPEPVEMSKSTHDKPQNQKILSSIQFFAQQSDISFALLFGSRVNGITHQQSDWDFAVWFNISSVNERFIQKEQLRQQLAQLLATNKIDVIDLQTASLSIMSSVVANNIVLKGEDLLELMLFYKRVWSLEEDFYWRLQYENRTLSS